MKKIMAALFLSFACSLTAFGQDEKIETEATPTPTPEIQKSYTEDDVGEFIDSVESGDAAMVRRFLSAGMDPNEGVDSGNGEQALLRAIRRNHVEVVKALIEHGASMDVRGHPDLVTALMLAVRGGSPRMVKLLLEHKADPNERDDDGHTALFLASSAASISDWPPDALGFYLGEEEEDDDGFMNIYRRTPKEDRFAILKTLLDSGADVNALADDCGLSALMVAAMYGSPEVTRLLLAKGADPNAGTKDWHALRFATISFEELREGFSDGESGDPADASDEERQEASAYYRATVAGRAEVAELLRKAGARELWEWPDEPKESEQSSDDEQPEETATPPVAAH